MHNYDLKTMSQVFHIIPFFILNIIILCLPLHGGLSIKTTDTITSTSPVRDPHTIISRNEVFKLGFYTPENTTNRYMSVFYNISEKTVVWIANREKPLRDSSGAITISKDGNLVLVNGENEAVWSTNITRKNIINTTYAQILDSGNIVLYDNTTGQVIWQSFSHPSQVWLPTMPLIDDTRTGSKVMLSSWKNESDPGIGSFRAGLQATNIPQVFIWHSDGRPHYRTGPWNGRIFIGTQSMYQTLHTTTFSVTETSPGIFQAMENMTDYLMMFSLNSSGSRLSLLWNDRNKTWVNFASSPANECDVYGKCGAFGVCDIRGYPKVCSCLRGFEPVNRQEWELGNWTSGCNRRTQLQCKSNGGKEDEFLRLRNMKVPDYAERFVSSNEEECRISCLQNCSCIAYTYDLYDIGCMFWREGDEALIDAQQFPNFGVDFYIRLSASELEDDNNDRRTLLIAVPLSVITFSVLVLICIVRYWMLKKRGSKPKERNLFNANVTSSDSTAFFLQDKSKRTVNIEDFPLFAFDTLAKATNSFHSDNFLGKGGFGQVYKGKLENGKDVAVKRLSEDSSQGVDEFLNEMCVISKLQHRNLVKLIGCCVEKEQKMLIYEYMTNKSLDICLFDHSNPLRQVLNWEKRLNIIKGISRGLLYLHRDSRLRIIHRDLKASNVLLDQEWNPKISDFGMARIFAANQEQANTIRVVGTYGYMAPEYATEGIFSEKSDVYSFGVLMLEIISGKRNTHYCDHGLSSSLLGSAWKFFKDDDGVESYFLDQDMLCSNPREEILRCIHIALLCVQEFAEERPTIRTVISMLDGEIIDLPMPEQPVIAEKWNATTQSTVPIEYSINKITVTELHGR